MGYKTYAKKRTVKLSTNFNSYEFDCHGSGCCSTTIVNDELVGYLQKIRDHFKKPVIITSAYRCTKHNKNVGGVTGSRHLSGDAADIVVEGIAPKEVAKYAESIGIRGIGLYEKAHCGDDFVHIDVRPVKGFWYGHTQEKRTTFGGTPKIVGNIDTVKEVQCWLNQSYDAKLVEDGIYGPKTKAALIKVLQKALGVAMSGIYDPQTAAAITELKAGNKGEVVKALQGLLVCSGYKSAYVDGDYGNGTFNAVKSHQTKIGLYPNGCAEKHLLYALCK
jgi:hypothetical protein